MTAIPSNLVNPTETRRKRSVKAWKVNRRREVWRYRRLQLQFGLQDFVYDLSSFSFLGISCLFKYCGTPQLYFYNIVKGLNHSYSWYCIIIHKLCGFRICILLFDLEKALSGRIEVSIVLFLFFLFFFQENESLN